MSQYYFHLCDGSDVLLDPNGRELDRSSIGAVALMEARAIIAADATSGQIHLDQRIEVHDSDGEIVHQLVFEDAVTVTHLAVRGAKIRKPERPRQSGSIDDEFGLISPQ